MNSEYALVRLLLEDPHKIVALNRKGLRKKHFKNQEYGQAYKLIYDTHVKFNSTPTEEELIKFGIKRDETVIPHTIDHCASQVMDDFRKRLTKDGILAAGKALTKNGTEAALDIIQKLNQYMPDIEKAERSKNIHDYDEEFEDEYNFRKQFKGKIVGIPTGFDILDQATMGFRNQWLITLTGRNGQYKTWVMLYWALTAWKAGKNVAIFSCEMSVPELYSRIHSLGAKVPPTKVQHATMAYEEELAFKNHKAESKLPPYGQLIINDNPTSMSEVDLEIAEISETIPLDVVFVDSAYRMQADGDSESNRQASIARNAKNLAKKWNIPFICSVQLNREFAKANAGGKTKTVSGAHYVYGTDAWEQDSDMLFAIHRPDHYDAYHYSDFICTKFRHGPPQAYILEINLLVPKIIQIDAEVAKARIEGKPPPQTVKADIRFEQTKNILSQLQKQFEDTKLSLDKSEEKEDDDGMQEL